MELDTSIYERSSLQRATFYNNTKYLFDEGLPKGRNLSKKDLEKKYAKYDFKFNKE